MIINGEIILYSKDGAEIKSKHFNNRTERKKIIEGWEKFYKLSRKPLYYISVLPKLSNTKKGYISLFIERDFVDDSFYNNIKHRNEIIKIWVQRNKLEHIDYILNIIPYQPDESD